MCVYLQVQQAFFLSFLSFVQWSFTPFGHQLTHAFNIVLCRLDTFLQIVHHISRLLDVLPSAWWSEKKFALNNSLCYSQLTTIFPCKKAFIFSTKVKQPLSFDLQEFFCFLVKVIFTQTFTVPVQSGFCLL